MPVVRALPASGDEFSSVRFADPLHLVIRVRDSGDYTVSRHADSDILKSRMPAPPANSPISFSREEAAEIPGDAGINIRYSCSRKDGAVLILRVDQVGDAIRKIKNTGATLLERSVFH